MRLVVAMCVGPVLMWVLAGCSSNGTLALRFSDQLRNYERSTGESEYAAVEVVDIDEQDQHDVPVLEMDPVPDDVVLVAAIVCKIDVSATETRSIATEKSKAVLHLVEGESIPCHPDACTIILRYNDLLLNNPFRAGQRVVFRFTSDGSFFDIEGVPRAY